MSDNVEQCSILSNSRLDSMNQKIKELRNDIKRLEDKVENKDRDFIIFSVLVPIIVAGIAAIASLYQIRINSNLPRLIH